MNARSGWNAAQRAAEREPKKPRTLHGPVGERPPEFPWGFGGPDQVWIGGCEPAACRECGCMLCGCQFELAPSRYTCAVCDEPLSLGLNRCFKHRLEPTFKRELTLAEAEQACREGKVVRCVRDAVGSFPDVNYLFRIKNGVPGIRAGLSEWSEEKVRFPRFVDAWRLMRFEIVE